MYMDIYIYIYMCVHIWTVHTLQISHLVGPPETRPGPDQSALKEQGNPRPGRKPLSPVLPPAIHRDPLKELSGSFKGFEVPFGVDVR